MPSNVATMPLVIAHRGASRLAPENTLAAFARAIDLGADMLELDVQLSADGQMVVIHDDDVARTTDGKGLVRDLDLAAIRALEAGSWFAPAFVGERVPTLAEVCALASGRVALNVEVKAEAAEFAPHVPAFLVCLHDSGVFDSTVISSFQREVLEAIRRHSSDARLAYLYVKPWLNPADPELTRLRLVALHPNHRLLTRKQVEAAHAHGLAVNTWTVDDPARAGRLRDWGVDGIVTNVPDAIIAAFGAKETNDEV